MFHKVFYFCKLIMQLTIIRNVFSDKASIGNLLINSLFECNTLEDKDRGLTNKMLVDEILKIKVKSQTCIPYGDDYEIKFRYSPKFSSQYFYNQSENRLLFKLDYSLLGDQEKKKFKEHELIWISNTKGFEYSLFHWGNFAADTDGCILVGKYQKEFKDKILLSRQTYVNFYKKIVVHKKELIKLNIIKSE